MKLRRLPDGVRAETWLRRLPERGRVWLDGVPGHAEGRWSFLGAEPAEVRSISSAAADPFAALDTLGRASGDAALGVPIPHWIGFVSYDAAWADAERLGLRASPVHARGATPALYFARYESLLAHDHSTGRTWALGEPSMAEQALELGPPIVGAIEDEARAHHGVRIRAALEAIAAGEIYQVNLARRWQVPYRGSPLALYRAMREASPVPFGMYLSTPGGAVLARTMERFLSWDPRSGVLSTSPIKGTIARRGDDAAEEAALKSDDKERAEHSMIVDLMRNDLSRVAQTGSVEVHDALRVERFAGLSHLVSTVRARTRPDVTLRDVIEATFPPGSITGTPKLRAMELIEALEAQARGVYTGALGYVDRAGGVSLAVAIRTATIEGDVVRYFAGGGLVSASDEAREIAETELKARVFLDAIESLREDIID